MAIGYFIDSNAQTVTEVIGKFDLEEIRRYVGGWIEAAYRLQNDVIYVDEEGLLKAPNQFFALRAVPPFHQGHQFFAGNGLYLGEEMEDGETGNTTHLPPIVTLEELKKAIQFAQAAI